MREPMIGDVVRLVEFKVQGKILAVRPALAHERVRFVLLEEMNLEHPTMAWYPLVPGKYRMGAKT
jgi:hypothetical protein